MDIIKLFSISQSMSAIKRYSQLHLLKSESVMEHTGFVCLFTYILCEKINSVSDEEDKLNIGIALEKAVIHDIDEVVTGDIPRPTKYHSKESSKIFENIADDGIKQIISELDLGFQSRIELNWKTAKDDSEGAIVALADLASVVYKLWDEVILLGNKKLILQGKQVFTYVQNLSKEIEKNFHFTYDQQLAINNVIYQLLQICAEINKIENPLTLKTFERSK
jgi:5'-deoxynucleotidase YfbR-like HD superfamily hydrolase